MQFECINLFTVKHIDMVNILNYLFLYLHFCCCWRLPEGPQKSSKNKHYWSVSCVGVVTLLYIYVVIKYILRGKKNFTVFKIIINTWKRGTYATKCIQILVLLKSV